MTEVGDRFVDAVARRDFDAVAACFSPDAEVRILTPHQLRELSGPAEAADRFRAWFGPMDGFELLDAGVEHIADRVRIRWHTRGCDPEKGWQENDHTGYAQLDDSGLIVALNVSCTGFRPSSTP